MQPDLAGQVALAGTTVLAIGGLDSMVQHSLNPDKKLGPALPVKLGEPPMRLEQRFLNHVRRADLHFKLRIELLLGPRAQVRPQLFEDFAQGFPVPLLRGCNSSLPVRNRGFVAVGFTTSRWQDTNSADEIRRHVANAMHRHRLSCRADRKSIS